ncbi:MAG: hypothetical protein ACRYGK_18775 [Janthinobacterium lividum]
MAKFTSGLLPRTVGLPPPDLPKPATGQPVSNALVKSDAGFPGDAQMSKARPDQGIGNMAYQLRKASLQSLPVELLMSIYQFLSAESSPVPGRIIEDVTNCADETADRQISRPAAHSSSDRKNFEQSCRTFFRMTFIASDRMKRIVQHLSSRETFDADLSSALKMLGNLPDETPGTRFNYDEYDGTHLYQKAPAVRPNLKSIGLSDVASNLQYSTERRKAIKKLSEHATGNSISGKFHLAIGLYSAFPERPEPQHAAFSRKLHDTIEMVYDALWHDLDCIEEVIAFVDNVQKHKPGAESIPAISAFLTERCRDSPPESELRKLAQEYVDVNWHQHDADYLSGKLQSLFQGFHQIIVPWLGGMLAGGLEHLPADERPGRFARIEQGLTDRNIDSRARMSLRALAYSKFTPGAVSFEDFEKLIDDSRPRSWTRDDFDSAELVTRPAIAIKALHEMYAAQASEMTIDLIRGLENETIKILALDELVQETRGLPLAYRLVQLEEVVRMVKGFSPFSATRDIEVMKERHEVDSLIRTLLNVVEHLGPMNQGRARSVFSVDSTDSHDPSKQSGKRQALGAQVESLWLLRDADRPRRYTTPEIDDF